MTKSSTNLKLQLFDTVSDSGSMVAKYIEVATGTSASSNMGKIDLFANSISGSIQRLSASMIEISASTTRLSASMVVSGSYNQVEVNVYGKVISGSVTNRVSIGGGGLLINKSGSPVPAGETVIYNSISDRAFTVTGSKPTTAYWNNLSGSSGSYISFGAINFNSSLAGIAYNTIANEGLGTVLRSGLLPVKVSGCAVRGNWLISGSSGSAIDSLQILKPKYGAIGVATETITGTSGSVLTDVSILPYTTKSHLKQLDFVTHMEGTSTPTTRAHHCPVGTDLLVVRMISNNTPTVTFNGISLTAVAHNSNSSGGYDPWIFGLLNPSIGTYNIVITSPTTVTAIATNYSGANQVNPFRTPRQINEVAVLSSSFSYGLQYIKGDILIDVFRGIGTWTPVAAGQTKDLSGTGTANGSTNYDGYLYNHLNDIGVDTDSTMAWVITTTSLSYYTYVSIPIAGS